MGLSIHYRGRLADLSRIEDFEDRVLDLVLAIGGTAEIWRSTADDDPSRMVRGIIATLAPGQESTSLLFTPEGWLISLLQIDDAECGLVSEPPWCSVKTQFGPVESHVALIELLRALQNDFLTDLEVSDEGGYWETRDLQKLAQTHAQLQDAIDGIQEGLKRYGLSREAAEDPAILATRIERIAAQVQKIIARPAEHPDPFSDDDGEPSDDSPDPDQLEARWDDFDRHNRRRQEHLHRALEERLQNGEPHEEAFDSALRDIGIPVPDDLSLADDDDDETDSGWSIEMLEAEDDEPWSDSGESWKSSLGSDAEDGDAEDDDAEDDISADDPDDVWDPFARDRHPLQQRASDLYQHLDDVFDGREEEHEMALRSLFQAAGELMGGLAQATGDYGDEDESLGREMLGLHIVQLKRALRGVAFARGAVFQLGNAADPAIINELHETLQDMERDVFQLLGETRAALGPDE